MASGRAELRSRGGGGGEEPQGELSCGRSPKGTESHSGRQGAGSGRCPVPGPASSPRAPRVARAPAYPLPVSPPHSPALLRAPSILVAALGRFLRGPMAAGLTAGEGRPGLPAGPGPGRGGGCCRGWPTASRKWAPDAGEGASVSRGCVRQEVGAGLLTFSRRSPGSPCGRKEATLGGAGEPSAPTGRVGLKPTPQAPVRRGGRGWGVAGPSRLHTDQVHPQSRGFPL